MEVSGVDSIPAGLRLAPPKSVADVEKEMRRLLTPRAPLMAAPAPAMPYPGIPPFNPLAVGGIPVASMMVPGMAVPIPVVLPTGGVAVAGATPSAASTTDVDPLEGRNVDPTKKEEILRTL
jgi:hypothetical protein